MKKLILSFILLLSPFITLQADEVFDFDPILVDKAIRIEAIGSNSTGDIFAAGNLVINPNPFNYTSNLKIYKSTDIGKTWELLFTQENELLSNDDKINRNPAKLICIDSMTILLFTDSYDLFRSTDGGATWIRDEFIKNYIYRNAKKSKRGEVVVLSFNVIQNKVNNYLSFFSKEDNRWSSIRIPTEELFETYKYPFINSVFYSDNNTVNFNVIDSEKEKDSIIYINYIVSTSDRGKTWQKKKIGLQNFANTFYYVSENRLLFWGITDNKYRNNSNGKPFGDNLISESTNNGETWNSLLYEQDTMVNAYLPFNIELYTDRYLIGEEANGNLKFYDFEKNIISRIIPDNSKLLSENYGYNSNTDYMIYDNRLFLTSHSGYIFEVDLSKPITNVENENLTRDLLLYPYPQPANTSVTIEFDSQKYNLDKQDIAIYNIEGQQIKNQDVEINNNSIIWDCSSALPGIYLINIKHGTEEKAVKVVVK